MGECRQLCRQGRSKRGRDHVSVTFSGFSPSRLGPPHMSAVPPVTNSRMPPWIKAGLVLLSAGLGMSLWVRPPAPAWIDDHVGSLTNPIGITEDGRVLYLSSPTQLMVRDVATGKVVAEHRLNQPCSTWSGQLTRDGERVVLATDGPSKSYCTFSTRDGRLLFPLLVANTTSVSALSFDGHYLMVFSGGTGPSKGYQTFDLHTGLPVWSCSEDTLFSGNSPTAYSLLREGVKSSLVIRSMDDGRELGRVEIPKVAGRRLIGISSLRNGSVGFSFESATIPIQPDVIMDAEIWSGRVERNILTDFRRETMCYFRQVDAGLTVIGVRDETICHEMQIRNLQDHVPGRIWLKWQEWSLRLGFIKRFSTQQYSWQQVSTATGWYIGKPISIDIPFFTVSPDGKWLVCGGPNIAAYSIPTGPSLSETLAAVLLPWGMAWLVCSWTRRTRGRTTNAVPNPQTPLEYLK